MNLLEYHLGKGVRAFSTLRNSGGVGEGAYASFNITPYCGDSLENVAASRVELAEELGIIDERIILPTQKHTNTVKVLDDAYCKMLMRWLLSAEEFVLVSRLLIAFQYFCLMKNDIL